MDKRKGTKTCNNLQNNTQKAVYRRIDNTMAKRKGTKTCNNLQNNTQKAVNRRIDNTMAKRKGAKRQTIIYKILHHKITSMNSGRVSSSCIISGPRLGTHHYAQYCYLSTFPIGDLKII